MNMVVCFNSPVVWRAEGDPPTHTHTPGSEDDAHTVTQWQQQAFKFIIKMSVWQKKTVQIDGDSEVNYISFNMAK